MSAPGLGDQRIEVLQGTGAAFGLKILGAGFGFGLLGSSFKAGATTLVVLGVGDSPKYEGVYLKAYETAPEGRAGIKEWIRFYTHERTHQLLGRQTPAHVYFSQSTKGLAA